MRLTLLLIIGALPMLNASARAGDTPVLSVDEVRSAIERCTGFLLADQNSDGSWGGPRGAVSTFSGTVWSNPETHRSWKVATTGLCYLALRDAPPSDEVHQAADRATDYLIQHAAVGRPSAWDTMNGWAYIYGLQALAKAFADPRYADSPRREQCRDTAEILLHKLETCQGVSGGWGYLEFNQPRTTHQQWATSFTTAAGVVAMVDAREAGLEVNEGLLRRAVRAVERCRLPSGAFTYSVPAIADPRSMEWIDQIKGSLGRTQACNFALLAAGHDVPEKRITDGLNHLFHHHRFLDIALNKPIPHETFYYNSGYFYLFGHYYAARLIGQLPEQARAKYWPPLQYHVAKLQQKDGSMWDYDMHAYHKPYGTAFALMTLKQSLPKNPEPEPEP